MIVICLWLIVLQNILRTINFYRPNREVRISKDNRIGGYNLHGYNDNFIHFTHITNILLDQIKCSRVEKSIITNLS